MPRLAILCVGNVVFGLVLAISDGVDSLLALPLLVAFASGGLLLLALRRIHRLPELARKDLKVAFDYDV